MNLKKNYGPLITPPKVITLSSSPQNNLDIGNGQLVRCDGSGLSAAVSITGMTGGVEGRWLRIWNNTGQSLQFQNEDTNSSAANRIAVSNTFQSGGQTYANVTDQLFIDFMYLASRWRVVSVGRD